MIYRPSCGFGLERCLLTVTLLLATGACAYAQVSPETPDIPQKFETPTVKDAKGAVEKWSVEMASVGMLARAGWRRDTVKPGDEITVIGNRAKDGRPFLHLTKLVFANGQEMGTNAQ